VYIVITKVKTIALVLIPTSIAWGNSQIIDVRSSDLCEPPHDVTIRGPTILNSYIFLCLMLKNLKSPL